MHRKRLFLPLLMTIVMMAMNPQKMWAECNHTYVNGICTVSGCGAYQAPTGDGLEADPYKIANAGQLLWFMNEVSKNSTETNKKAYYAELADNIVVNKEVLNNGNLNGTPAISWIMPDVFYGVFDGKGHTISGVYQPGTTSGTAMICHNYGIIRNIGVIDSYFGISTARKVGTFVMYNYNTITDCYSFATIVGSAYCGGIAAQSDYPYVSYAITNCYYAGNINNNDETSSPICSDRYNARGTVSNNYFLESCLHNKMTNYRSTSVTLDEMKSGKVAYLLQAGRATAVWGQTISGENKQDYPVLGGNPVYLSGKCSDTERTGDYTNNPNEVTHGTLETHEAHEVSCTAAGNTYYAYCPDCKQYLDENKHTISENSWILEQKEHIKDIECQETDYNTYYYHCSVCNKYYNINDEEIAENSWILTPPTYVDGYYQISSEDDLLWFASKVNNGKTSLCAKLTANLDMTGKDYTPMCYATSLDNLSYNKKDTTQAGYLGVFDGQGHTISNLTIAKNKTQFSAGLFGNNTGTIKNLGIINFSYDQNEYDGRFGAIAGVNFGTIRNCFVTGSTVKSSSHICGAITGGNYGGTIENCFEKGNTVSAHGRCGHMVGDANNDGNTLAGKIINCYSDDKLGNENQGGYPGGGQTGRTNVSDFASGEICYLLNGSTTTGGWYQKLNSDPYPVLLPTGENTVCIMFAKYTNDQTTDIDLYTVGNYGYATFYSDFSYECNVPVYIASVNGSEMKMTEYKGTVPAQTGVILRGKNATKATLTYAIPASAEVSSALTGTLVAKAAGSNDALFQYVNGILGFYGYNGTIAAYKAYYEVPASGAKSLTVRFDDSTGIDTVETTESENTNTACYNITGQRLNSPVKGINIINGKKIMIK